MIAEPPLVRQDLFCQSEVHLASVCFIGIVHVPCGVYMVRMIQATCLQCLRSSRPLTLYQLISARPLPPVFFEGTDSLECFWSLHVYNHWPPGWATYNIPRHSPIWLVVKDVRQEGLGAPKVAQEQRLIQGYTLSAIFMFLSMFQERRK